MPISHSDVMVFGHHLKQVDPPYSYLRRTFELTKSSSKICYTVLSASLFEPLVWMSGTSSILCHQILCLSVGEYSLVELPWTVVRATVAEHFSLRLKHLF